LDVYKQFQIYLFFEIQNSLQNLGGHQSILLKIY